ncbi:hypothetical protein F5X98DRAFT_345680 [Xylaria grammica]|nr:hypothetical protein F5X98DRAFT_345680 [Xylaria grammica]
MTNSHTQRNLGTRPASSNRALCVCCACSVVVLGCDMAPGDQGCVFLLSMHVCYCLVPIGLFLGTDCTCTLHHIHHGLCERGRGGGLQDITLANKSV